MRGRWSVLVGALIVQVVLGTVYAFSVFVRPLETEFGWDRATDSRAEFLRLARELEERAGGVRDAAVGPSSSELGARVSAMRATCTACHTRFRVLPLVR